MVDKGSSPKGESMDKKVMTEATPSSVDTLEQHFGCWPSFHDAELLEIHLARKGQSHLVVRLAENPSYENRPDLKFILNNVSDLELEDFSSQNILFDMHLEEGEGRWKLLLSPSYGIGGYVVAADITIMALPGS